MGVTSWAESLPRCPFSDGSGPKTLSRVNQSSPSPVAFGQGHLSQLQKQNYKHRRVRECSLLHTGLRNLCPAWELEPKSFNFFSLLIKERMERGNEGGIHNPGGCRFGLVGGIHKGSQYPFHTSKEAVCFVFILHLLSSWEKKPSFEGSLFKLIRKTINEGSFHATVVGGTSVMGRAGSISAPFICYDGRSARAACSAGNLT